MPSTPILLAWSGGKDCLMALDRLLANPEWTVEGLLTTLDRGSDRVAMHDVRADVMRAQADALGLPLIEMPIDGKVANADYESALALALVKARARTPACEVIAFGDIFLADIRAWREASLQRLGWSAVFPLWEMPTDQLAGAFLGRGHRAVITTVDLQQLDGAFCGRDFDEAFLAELPSTVDPCGENGEFHTLCHDGPLFSSPMPLEALATTTRESRFRCQDYRLR